MEHQRLSSRQVFLRRGKISVESVPTPLVQEHNVLVRMHYSFISSGTESSTVKAAATSPFATYINNLTRYTSKLYAALKEHGYAGTRALVQERRYKVMPLGYSCAGQIVACGSKVRNLRIGDYVACAGSAHAYHADNVSVPQNLVVRISHAEFLKAASITALGAIALQGIRRAQLEIGQTVCVVGLGLIGQLTVQLARQAGCTVIGIDIRDDRIALAYQSGAEKCFNSNTTDVIREINYATDHQGVDVTLITAASQSEHIVQNAMLMTRRKGRVVVVGDVKLSFDRDPFYAKEIDFFISCSYGPGRYDVAYEQQSIDYPYAYVQWTEQRNMAYIVRLIEKKELKLDHLITHNYPLEHAQEAYAQLNKGALGVVLSYDHIPQSTDLLSEQTPVDASEVKTYKLPAGKNQVALIGAGGFAKTKILPLITTHTRAMLHSIIDTDMASALTLARVYNAPNAHNDYRVLLNDDRTNLVIIASPHAYHTEQALACLHAGKAVLVEKPAAISDEEYHALKSFLEAHPQARYCVDFNRSYAPFMQAIKKQLATRTQPALITYRMNAGHLNADHWIQSSEHGGRIIGEACHIFELFYFLTDSTPHSITVGSSTSATSQLSSPDNVIITVTMHDGSCCVLTYTSCGHHNAGKEYMEVFFDGKTIIMDDFLELKGYGLPSSLNQRAGTQDKGHQHLYMKFFEAAYQEQWIPPIPVARILHATKTALIADKLARCGGSMMQLS